MSEYIECYKVKNPVFPKNLKRLSSTNLVLFFFLLISCSTNSKSLKTEYSSKPQGFYYRTKKGDTIFSISREYNIDYRDILKANSLDINKKLYAGQLLFIPATEKVDVYGQTQNVKQTQSVTEKRKLPDYHTVKKDETLASISRIYNIELTELMRRNKHIVPEKLQVGEKINIKQESRDGKSGSVNVNVSRIQVSSKMSMGKYHIVRKGDTLVQIANLYGIGLKNLLQFNKSINVRKLQIGQKIYIPVMDNSIDIDSPSERIGNFTEQLKGKKGDFIWPLPVNGQFIRGFVPTGRRQHKGIDIAVQGGTKVLASQSGRVIYCGNEIKSYGNMVIIEHGSGITTVYAHLKRVLAIKNQRVRKGDEIGTVGNTGRTTGYHLHFEIRVEGEAINPLQYL